MSLRAERRTILPAGSRLTSVGFWGRFLAAVGVAAVGLGAMAIWQLKQESRYRSDLIAAEGSYVVKLESEFLVEEFQAVQTDLRFLAAEAGLVQYASGEEQLRRGIEASYVNFAIEKACYDQIRLLGVDGRELIRVNYREGVAEAVSTEELQPKSSRYYYQEAIQLDPGEVFVSPFDLNVEHGEIETPLKPVIRFLTPVVDASGEKLGLLALNYLGAPLLAKMRELGVATRGKLLLVNVDGQYLQADQSQQEWGWLLESDDSFAGDYAEAWARVSNSAGGQFELDGRQFTVQRLVPEELRGRAYVAEALAGRQELDGESEPGTLFVISVIGDEDVAALNELFTSRLLVLYSGVMALVVGLAAVWAHAATVRREQDRMLASSESRLRLMSTMLLKAQEQERRQLSRLLHDEIGQQATAIHLDLRSALQSDELAGMRVKVERAAGVSNELLSRLHEIATDVRPSVLDDLGLEEAVESFIDEYRDRTEIEVDCDVSLGSVLIDGTIKENIYRIMQEALANVAKHAQTSRAQVHLSCEADEIRLEVSDWGCGMTQEQMTSTTRLGLLGMRERVGLLGGSFELSSTSGEGTRIDVAIPLKRSVS